MIKQKKIILPLLNTEGDFEETPIFFYDRNPTRKGLDFDEILDQKAEFLRYAIQLNCRNPIRKISRNLHSSRLKKSQEALRSSLERSPKRARRPGGT